MKERILYETDGRATSQPQPQELMDSKRLGRETTREMVRTLEWAAPVFQGVVLFGSGINDPYPSYGRTIILCLATAHLVLIPFYVRGYGPVTRSASWMTLYITQCLLVNTLQAALSTPRTYGDSLSCVPGCNYSAPVWLLMAFYPWLPLGFVHFRRLFEGTLLGIYYCFFLLLARLNNGSLSFLNVKSASMSLSWLLVAYLFGEALGWMCRVAARKQLYMERQNYAEFFDFLHSHVKSRHLLQSNPT